MSPRRLGRAALLLILAAPTVSAQEFAAPDPAGEPGLSALLERGLAPAADGIGASALAIRWHGLPELDTRSVAVGVGWRSARAALGVSQTGEADLGWSALAVAAGHAAERGGFALRGCARRRRPLEEGGHAESGGEVGAGAWVAATPSTVVWASAPQLWTRGDPPPLERWLEIGTRVRIADARLWLARAAAPGSPRGMRAEHLAGIAVPCGPAAVWLEARDHPARGGLGLAVGARTIRVHAAFEGHPVLGETVRLALAWGERPWW
jgi:hypothetical protein